MDKFKWDKLQVSVAPIRMRKKMFGSSDSLKCQSSPALSLPGREMTDISGYSSDWFGLNVNFDDRTPVFVQSVFET